MDHATARRQAATALDGALSRQEVAALEAHLTSCVECGAVAAALERDAGTLQRLDLGPVPIGVRANLAIAAEHGSSRSHAGRWIGLVAVGALLVAMLGGGALGGGSGPTEPTAAPGNAVSWKTDVAALSAADFAILADDKTFTARVPDVAVESDPGDVHYRTLELTWREQDVEQRLSLYFGGDDSSWWVDEIRVFDSVPPGKWFVAKGPFFRSAIGAPWTGDIDLAFPHEAGVGEAPARLRLRDAVIQTRVADNVDVPPGGAVALAEHDRPFGSGGVLRCSGILQMSPAEAEAKLNGLGYGTSWRLVTKTGPNTGFAEVHKHAPTGVINSEPAVGSSGELILFVAPFGDEGAKPVPAPTDCP